MIFVEVPKDCPFPTIFKSAMDRLYDKNFSPIPREIPEFAQMFKGKCGGLQMKIHMLRENNERLISRNNLLSEKIKDYAYLIRLLQGENYFLANLVKKLRSNLKRYRETPRENFR